MAGQAVGSGVKSGGLAFGVGQAVQGVEVVGDALQAAGGDRMVGQPTLASGEGGSNLVVATGGPGRFAVQPGLLHGDQLFEALVGRGHLGLGGFQFAAGAAPVDQTQSRVAGRGAGGPVGPIGVHCGHRRPLRPPPLCERSVPVRVVDSHPVGVSHGLAQPAAPLLHLGQDSPRHV